MAFANSSTSDSLRYSFSRLGILGMLTPTQGLRPRYPGFDGRLEARGQELVGGPHTRVAEGGFIQVGNPLLDLDRVDLVQGVLPNSGTTCVRKRLVCFPRLRL